MQNLTDVDLYMFDFNLLLSNLNKKILKSYYVSGGM